MRFLRAASWAIEPLTATVFVLLWVNAEVGRGVTGLVGMLGFGLAIALSRVLPYLAFVSVGTTLVLQCFGIGRFESTDWPANLAILIVVGLVTAHGTIRRVWVPLVAGSVALLWAIGLMVFPRDGWLSWTSNMFAQGPRPMVSVFIALGSFGVTALALFWGAGWGVRAMFQLDRAAKKQETIEVRLADSEVQLAIAEERNRIAQEMHDVLAHSLAVVVAQADGARYIRSSRPAAVDAALLSIAEAARAALGDVGGIIDGVLDGRPAPQPGLEDLDHLIATVESAGLEVSLTQAGEAQPLAPGQQLAVYRIVQEGLTNALRHRGRESSVSVVLDWRGPGLALQLLSSGGSVSAGGAAPTPGTDAPGTGSAGDAERVGRGIPGMEERARLAGGWAAAGPDENGDHRITAFIPYRELQRPVDPRPLVAA